MDTRGIMRAAAVLLMLAAVALRLAGCAKNTTRAAAAETAGAADTFTDGRDGKSYKTAKMPDGRTWLAENLNYMVGDSKDGRDGKTYKTVIIGGKMWTAENMNYETPQGSRCYNDDADSCAKYGRLYTWRAAAGACPVGWRLPARRDWNELARTVGGRGGKSDGEDQNLWHGAGGTLKAGSGWKDNDGRSGDGSDDYGFSALPGGFFNSDGFFAGAGRYGAWWAAAKAGGIHNAYDIVMAYNHGYMRETVAFMEQGASVRCVRDAGGARDEKAEWERGQEIGRRDAEEKKKTERERLEEEQRIECLSEYFADPRDGRRYRAVTIGGLKWMAENLLYEPKSGGSWCYYNNALYCAYGRLYDWGTADTICPAGWRLPSRRDWDDLAEAAGGRKELGYKGAAEWRGVGGKLKSKSGWDPHRPDGWSDEYGFSARPNGRRKPDGTFVIVKLDGQSAWWTATETGGDAFTRSLDYLGDALTEDKHGKDAAYPVRCVADVK